MAQRLKSWVAVAGLLAVGTFATQDAFATTITADSTVPVVLNASDTLVLNATTTSVTLQTTQTTAVTMDATPVASNTLQLLSASGASNSVIDATGAGSNTIVISQPTPIGTTTSTAGIYNAQNSLITKSAGTGGDVIAVNANASIYNAGTISGASGVSSTLHVSGASLTLVNTGTITAADSGADSVVLVDADGELTLNNSGTISSSGDDAVIDASASGAIVRSFTNSGIISSGSGNAIDVTGDALATTLTLSDATVTGGILLGGTLSDTINIIGTDGGTTITGDITGDSTAGGVIDADVDFNYTGQLTNISQLNIATGKTVSFTANTAQRVDNSSNKDLTLLGGGTLNITAVNQTNAIDTGTGDLIIDEGTLVTDYDSAIDGDVTVNVSGTIAGDLTVTGANAIVTLNGGTLTGGLTGNGATQVLNIASAFTTVSNTVDFETINVNENFTVASGTTVTGATALNVAAGKTLSAQGDVTASGALTSGGTLRIGEDQTVTVGSVSGAIDHLITEVDANSSGKLVIGSGTAAVTSLTFDYGNAYIANGTTRTVIDGASGTAAFTDIVDSSAFVSATAVNSSGDLIATFSRLATFESAGSNAQNKAVASQLDSLGASGNAELEAIAGAIQNQTTLAGGDAIIESLLPVADGLAPGSAQGQNAFIGTVGNRLAVLRDGAVEEGIVTGDGVHARNFWVDAFGATQDQDEKDGIKGFTANSFGFSVGADSQELVKDATVGLAFGYANTSVDSDAASNAQTDIDAYQLSGYYSRELPAYDAFMDITAGLALNNYDTKRTVAAISQEATADFDGMQYTAGVKFGRLMELSNGMLFTPTAGLKFTHLDIDDYTETGAGGASLIVESDSNQALVFELGGTTAWNIMKEYGTWRPELRAIYSYDLLGDEFSASSTFVGGGTAFKTEGAKVSQHGLKLGAGIRFVDIHGFEAGATYDADMKSDYMGHTGKVNLKWKF